MQNRLIITHFMEQRSFLRPKLFALGLSLGVQHSLLFRLILLLVLVVFVTRVEHKLREIITLELTPFQLPCTKTIDLVPATSVCFFRVLARLLHPLARHHDISSAEASFHAVIGSAAARDITLVVQ